MTSISILSPERHLSQLLKHEKLVYQQPDFRLLREKADSLSPPSQVWREKVVQWCYDVVDHVHEDRHVVGVAMSILDRYVSSTDSRFVEEAVYEVASMTALFLAIRIIGNGKLSIEDLVSMSRNGIRKGDILSMGSRIVQTLSWEHKIITPVNFIRAYARHLNGLMPRDQIQHVFEQASYLVEVAVYDSMLIHHRVSDLALAAFVSAMKSHVPHTSIPFDISSKACLLESIANRLNGMLCGGGNSGGNRSQESNGPHLIEDDQDHLENNLQQYSQAAISSPQKVTRIVSEADISHMFRGDASVETTGSATLKRTKGTSADHPTKRARYNLATFTVE